MKPGRGKEAEENARRDLGIASKDQIYLIAGGRVVSWEEVTMMEENAMVGVTCAMRGGARKKKKERNPLELVRRKLDREKRPRKAKAMKEMYAERNSSRSRRQKSSGWKRSRSNCKIGRGSRWRMGR